MTINHNDSISLILPVVEDLQTKNPLVALWNQYILLLEASKEDQHAVDFDASRPPSTTGVYFPLFCKIF